MGRADRPCGAQHKAPRIYDRGNPIVVERSSAIARTYTHSLWTVKEGKEDEFVRRWLDLAEWSAAQGLTGSARLLRDTDNPRVFISFGPWESLERVARWRSSPGFHERVARLQEVLDAFEPRTLDQVAES